MLSIQYVDGSILEISDQILANNCVRQWPFIFSTLNITIYSFYELLSHTNVMINMKEKTKKNNTWSQKINMVPHVTLTGWSNENNKKIIHPWPHMKLTWTLTKRLKKKLDSNYTRMLRAILNKSWQQHPTRHQLYGHLPPITKTIQARRTRHAGHCWRSKDELVSDVLLWTFAKSKAGQPARTYIQQLCDDTGCNPEDLPEAMNDRERVRDIHASRMTWWWWWRKKNHQKQLQMKKKKVLFHQDNAPCYKSIAMMAKIHELHIKLLLHPPYSPDLATSDYWLFADLKRMLQGKRTDSNEKVISETETYFEAKDKLFYKKGIELLEKCWNQYITLEGDYINE